MEAYKTSIIEFYNFDYAYCYFCDYIFFYFEAHDSEFNLATDGGGTERDDFGGGDIKYLYHFYSTDGVHQSCDKWGLPHKCECGRRYASISEAIVK